MINSPHKLLGSLTALTLVLALASGCKSDCEQHGVDKCSDIPQGAIPQPNGTFACQWQTAQIAAAGRDLFMIYEYEWYLGGKELGPFGQRHLAELAGQLKTCPCKVAIEPHFDTAKNAPDDDLNNARVIAIVGRLAAAGVDDAAARVEVALPSAEGLYGEEAVRIGTQRLQGTGTTSGGASSFGGPFGGTGTTSPSGGFGGVGVIGGSGF